MISEKVVVNWYKNLILIGAFLGCFFLGGSAMKLIALKEHPKALSIFNASTTLVLVVASFVILNHKEKKND